MKVAKIPIGDAHWCEFVSSHPTAGPFHLPAWTSLIADCYHFDAFALVVRDSDGEILAGIPVVETRSLLGERRWVSLPFSDACPLLVRPDTAEADVLDPLIEYVLANRTRELLVRSELAAGAYSHPVQVGYNHYIELPSDPRDLHVRKNHRNMRNRAHSAGMRVARSSSPDDLSTFYRLQTLTRRRLGVPVQPRRFFDLLGERLLSRGHGFVATATLDGEAVSAAVYLSYKSTLVSKYHATGPTRSENGSSHLVDWEITSAACSEGYHTLDLGRTDTGAEGLRLYKSGWGAIEIPLVYTHLSGHPTKSVSSSIGDLPKRIIRSSPLWVCRALGEALYRWTA